MSRSHWFHAQGFSSKSIPHWFLSQNCEILIIVGGETPTDLCSLQEKKKPFFPNSNVVTAFQTHFAAQNDHNAQQGSSSNSLPVSGGQIIRFLIWKVLTKLPSRGRTTCALLPGSFREELSPFYCQERTRFQSSSIPSTAPCQYVWIEAQLLVLYFPMFKLALPSWKPQ